MVCARPLQYCTRAASGSDHARARRSWSKHKCTDSLFEGKSDRTKKFGPLKDTKNTYTTTRGTICQAFKTANSVWARKPYAYIGHNCQTWANEFKSWIKYDPIKKERRAKKKKR